MEIKRKNAMSQARYACGPEAFKQMDTESLRREFLIEQLFKQEEISWIYSHFDRMMVAGALPLGEGLPLVAVEEQKAEYFLERRELGIINVGGAGWVEVGNQRFDLEFKEALYVGRGHKDVVFFSEDALRPAKFYLNSTPAHQSYPCKKVTTEEAQVVTLGALETSNHRTINKLLVSGTIQTCQLQMGMTELKPGSVWNTMPAHTHDRRMEVYFYFELPEDQAVCHFIGKPEETRHIWMKNEQAVISPPWSIHAGAATSNYTFIWGMAGENLDYDDMDRCDIQDLR